MKLTRNIVIFGFVLAFFIFSYLQSISHVGQAAEETDTIQGPVVSELVVPGISVQARNITTPQQNQTTLDKEINPRHNPLIFEPDQGQRGTWDRANVPTDELIRASSSDLLDTPGLDFSFEGTGNPTGCGSCSPPDTVGDVGLNHYVQMVNATKVAVYDKSGNLLNTPFNLGTLWTSGNCASNAGDPVVLYDSMADRWLLSQFASPSHMCVAISQTADPLGSYFTYTFAVGSFPDYFKFGVWPDGYYMSANENTYTAYAFDRAKMLTGAPATFQKFTGGTNLYLPSDLDGPTLPPTGAPNLFYTFKDNSFHGGSDRVEVREFHVDWTTPANSTFTLVSSLNVTPYTYTVCGFFNFSCIHQSGTTQRVDAVSEWPMFRFPYRNFGSHETLVGTFTVGGGLGQDGGAVRWFELRNTGGGWTLFQEGTIDPGDGNDRFMGSIAMDQAGNMGIGYSVSSGAIHPQIRYATRLATDPLGTMQTEAILIAPNGSQTGSNRWGDYSAMGIDPANDCTFWYTNEYYPTNASSTWKTRVGVFTIPECLNGGTPTPTPTGPTPTPTNTPTFTPTPPPGANELHVASITMAVVPNGNNRFHAEALVTVHDENNQPISGATVSGNFTGDSSSSASGVTNAAGQVTLASTIARFGANWAFCVTNLAKTGYTYNPAANLETCDSTGGGPTATPTPTATPPPGGTMHLGDLDGTSAPGAPGRWNATVTITVHDASHNPVAGVTVSAAWSSGATGTGSCVTNASGQCALTKTGIRNSINSVTLSVTNATGGGLTYTPADNHDPDGDSNGTVITVNKP